MVYKCCVVDYRSNYAGEERATVFSFPKQESLRKIWIKFVNRKDLEPTPSSFICIKHFEGKYYRKGKNDKRYRLTKILKPVSTIFNPNIQTSECSSSSHIISPVTVTRRSPRKHIYQDGQYQSFMNYDLINKLSDIEESISPVGFLFKKNNDYFTFYKIEFSEKRASEVTECIKIDEELHVKLFFKGCPVPLPQWFRQGSDCFLTRKSMLENFPVYLRIYADNHSSVFEELLQYRFTKKPIYSPNIIRYNMLLRCTSIQSYKVLLQDFQLPSLSLLQKFSSGTIDAVKCTNALRIGGKISEDVCMIFDKMYLQKSQEYFGEGGDD